MPFVSIGSKESPIPVRRWHTVTFSATEPLTRPRLDEILRAVEPQLIILREGAGLDRPGEDIAETAHALSRHEGAFAVAVTGRMPSLAAHFLFNADLAMLGESALLDLADFSDHELALVAADLGALLTRSRGLEFLVRGRHDAASLSSFGLAAAVFPDVSLLEDTYRLLAPLQPGALCHLKRAWRSTRDADQESALAAERLAFARCFERGAPDGIAEWLRSRFHTSA
jgi:hypothetical protein